MSFLSLSPLYVGLLGFLSLSLSSIIYDPIIVSASPTWSALVNVTVCNGFPGSGMVSVSWGSATSPKLAYESCATLLFNNATTSGTATLFNSAGTVIQSATVTLLHNQNLCTDGNRNILLTYEDNTGALTGDLQLPVGCSSLVSGQGEVLFYNADCALSSKAVDFWILSGSTSEKVGASLPCGTASYLSVPSGGGGMIASVLAEIGDTTNSNSGTLGSGSLVAYMNGTTTVVAGPFDISSMSAPNSDGTVIIVMSGDVNHTAVAWSSTVNGPDLSKPPQGSSSASSLDKLSPIWILCMSFVTIAAARISSNKF